MSEYKFSSTFLLTGYIKFIESKSRKCSICLKFTPRWAPLYCEGVGWGGGYGDFQSLPVPAAAASFAAALAASTRHCGFACTKHISHMPVETWVAAGYIIIGLYFILTIFFVHLCQYLCDYKIFTSIFWMFTIDIDLNEMTKQNTYLLGQNVITIR